MRAIPLFSLMHTTLGVLYVFCAATASSDPIFHWEAASGLTPDQLEHGPELFLSGNVPAPALADDALTITTTANAENVFYLQAEPLVETDRPFTFEFEMRLVSGASSADARGPVSIFITFEDAWGMLLSIDVDAVFFSSAPGVRGEVANVDTDEAAHTYRLQHDGARNLTLFYDGDEILSAAAYQSQADHGTLDRFGWGEGTLLAYGVSEWYSVHHDALGAIFEDSFEEP